MEALTLWFVGLVTAYPTGLLIITVLGTFLIVASILMPVIVKLTTWTDKDDKFWAAVEANPVFKVILGIVGRFSVYTPPKKP